MTASPTTMDEAAKGKESEPTTTGIGRAQWAHLCTNDSAQLVVEERQIPRRRVSSVFSNFVCS